MRGHYDFLMESKTDDPLDLGLNQVSCDCTSMEFALLPRNEWERLVQEQAENPAKCFSTPAVHLGVPHDNDKKPVPVPGGSQGVVRMNWSGKKDSGSRLRLGVMVYVQPKGDVSRRNFYRLETPVMMAMHMIRCLITMAWPWRRLTGARRIQTAWPHHR